MNQVQIPPPPSFPFPCNRPTQISFIGLHYLSCLFSELMEPIFNRDIFLGFRLYSRYLPVKRKKSGPVTVLSFPATEIILAELESETTSEILTFMKLLLLSRHKRVKSVTNLFITSAAVSERTHTYTHNFTFIRKIHILY
jgi:hypothetical protein